MKKPLFTGSAVALITPFKENGVDYDKFAELIEYHKILTKMYGEYMKLPPQDKQVTHHSNKVYIKD